MISSICFAVSPSTFDSPVMISVAHCVVAIDMAMTVLLVENEGSDDSRYGIGKQDKDDDNPEEQVGRYMFHWVISFRWLGDTI